MIDTFAYLSQPFQQISLIVSHAAALRAKVEVTIVVNYQARRAVAPGFPLSRGRGRL